MESTQLFSLFILSVIAIHLAATTGVRIKSWWQRLVAGRNRSQRPFVKVGVGVDLLAKTHTQQRSDWYVFFHCSDLVGKEPLPKRDISSGRDSVLTPLKKVCTTGQRPATRLTLS